MRFLFVAAVVALAVSAAKPNGADGIVSAAQSVCGNYPYSLGGGNDYGATYGVQQEDPPYCDDRNVVGFDCSGLSKYAVFQGTGISMLHNAQDQYDNCQNRVGIDSVSPGDLVFYGDGSSSSSIYHVAVYIGDNQMIEATHHDDNCVGQPSRQADMRTGDLVDTACRMW